VLPLIVGVTGHRPNRLADADGDLLRSRVASVLRTLGESLTGENSRTLLSALAEGADRIVAREALALGFRLEAVLPFRRSEYEKDFRSPESLAEFHDLLSRSDSIHELQGSGATRESRDSAYDGVGRGILDRVDALVAVWDGGRARGEGGTADVLGDALGRSIPVIWIEANPPHEARLLTAEGDEPFPTDAARLRAAVGPRRR
jgi:hypothetical protein